MAFNYKQGRFIPRNPNKYRGDPTNIIYRSGWELQTFKWLDVNSGILEWSSEEIVIPYISPVDGKPHRYFPDILAKIRGADGRIKNYLIEIKPYNQSIEPKVQTRVTKRYITEICTWGVNQAKWKAAREYCLDRQWIFKILTEKDLYTK